MNGEDAPAYRPIGGARDRSEGPLPLANKRLALITGGHRGEGGPGFERFGSHCGKGEAREYGEDGKVAEKIHAVRRLPREIPRARGRFFNGQKGPVALLPPPARKGTTWNGRVAQG